MSESRTVRQLSRRVTVDGHTEYTFFWLVWSTSSSVPLAFPGIPPGTNLHQGGINGLQRRGRATRKTLFLTGIRVIHMRVKSSGTLFRFFDQYQINMIHGLFCALAIVSLTAN